ncbi:nuclease-related domain-containing protein [Virgibacillus xinjiangensis]|uniref:Nuclease-related domain-containing protein n=1 Tax=Virgibacillus xinjiangensis TaxID=393090 RepID=A0ABV7CUA7_9BACI
MIIKKRGYSEKLAQLEAMERRLPHSHTLKQRVLTDYKSELRGIKGEREVDFPLEFLDPDKFLILHNVRLPDYQGYFQMDTLILSREFILILEVKNWYGTIIFGENGQVTRIGDNGREEGFKNPIPQTLLQQRRLQNWLRTRNVTSIPVTYLVVISHPSTIIKSSSSINQIPLEVIHNSDLTIKIDELDNLYSSPQLTKQQLHHLSRQIVENHQSNKQNLLDYYYIKKSDLVTGVFCPSCHTAPMVRSRQKWGCRQCGHYSDKAHLPAFKDYLLLIGNEISNKDARHLLQITSPHVAKRLLQNAKLPAKGKTSARVYDLSPAIKWNELQLRTSCPIR